MSVNYKRKPTYGRVKSSQIFQELCLNPLDAPIQFGSLLGKNSYQYEAFSKIYQKLKFIMTDNYERIGYQIDKNLERRLFLEYSLMLSLFIVTQGCIYMGEKSQTICLVSLLKEITFILPPFCRSKGIQLIELSLIYFFFPFSLEITHLCKVDTIICSNTVNLEIDDISTESLFKEVTRILSFVYYFVYITILCFYITIFNYAILPLWQ